MSARTNSSPASSNTTARRIGTAVAAAWADCRHANARMMQIQLGTPAGRRRRV